MASEDDPPLIASQGVGTGGMGHVCSGSKTLFRLPPPIPGKEGGGYKQEWHDAQIMIKRNYMAHRQRRGPMQEVAIPAAASRGGVPAGELPTPLAASMGQATERKRDVVSKYWGNAKSSLAGVAQQVQEQLKNNESIQKNAARVSSAIADAGVKVSQFKTSVAASTQELRSRAEQVAGQVGELTAERRKMYEAFVMEKMPTSTSGAAAAVGMFLARHKKAGGVEAPFDIARKQDRVEVVEISARNCIKTCLHVKAGDTVNWTFAVKSLDIMFHVKLRKMMDVGGAEEEDLVQAVKVDSSSLAEGTWTCAHSSEAGQVVLCWDNTRSLLRSKSIAYRAWLVQGAEKELEPAVSDKEEAGLAETGSGESHGEDAQLQMADHDQDAAQAQAEAHRKSLAQAKVDAAKLAAQAKVAAIKEEATRAAQEKAAADKAAAAAAAAAAASSEAELVAKAEDEAAADFFKDGVIDAAATPQAPQETLQVPQEEEARIGAGILSLLTELVSPSDEGMTGETEADHEADGAQSNADAEEPEEAAAASTQPSDKNKKKKKKK